MSLNLAERLNGRRGAGHRTAAEAVELMKEHGYNALHVHSSGEATLYPAHTGNKPIPVYAQSARSLIRKGLVKFKVDNGPNYKVYELA